MPPTAPSDGHRIDAARFAELAEAELAHYRAIDPDIGVHVEIRTDASGIMVSGRDLIVSAAAQIETDRGPRPSPARGRHPPRHLPQRHATSRSG